VDDGRRVRVKTHKDMRSTRFSTHSRSLSKGMDVSVEIDRATNAKTDESDGTVATVIETLLPIEDVDPRRVDRKRVSKREVFILIATALVLAVLITGADFLQTGREVSALLKPSLYVLLNTLNSTIGDNATSTANAGR